MPKMSKSSRRCRRPALLVQQTAEQLVEVPTIVPYSSLHGLVEQHVDIPVPHGRGGRGCGGGLQGLRPGQNSTTFSGAEHVDIPVPHGRGLQGFRPETGFFCLLHPRTRLVLRMRLLQRVFALLPKIKKGARLGPHSGSELSADFTPSTPPAYLADIVLELGMWRDEMGFVWVQGLPTFPGGTGWTTQDEPGDESGDPHEALLLFPGC